MRISDWSSDVCSSDLCDGPAGGRLAGRLVDHVPPPARTPARDPRRTRLDRTGSRRSGNPDSVGATDHDPRDLGLCARQVLHRSDLVRSEEHTSELQSLMRISYAVLCLKQKKKQQTKHNI